MMGEPAPPPPPPAYDERAFPPCCAGCGYLLVGLPAGPCPECGRLFDPTDGGTLVYAGWYNPVLYWLPGWIAAALLVAFVAGMLLLADVPWLIPGIAVPAAVGLVRHYGLGDIGAEWCLGLVVGIVAMSMLVGGPFLAVLNCLLVPLATLAGCVVGDAVRGTMKDFDYPQARWLP